MKDVICSNCGNVIQVTSVRAASAKSRGNNIFCSKECRLAGTNAYRHILRKCKECGKDFYPHDRTSKFCSRSCAAKFNNKNRVVGSECREKISKSLKLWNDNKKASRGNEINQSKELKLICQACGKEFLSNNKYKKYCSLDCRRQALSVGGRIGGLRSVKSQAENRRSKNEIMFAEMCKEVYPDTICNISMFNGWDADVIIPSIRLAVLWNGKWHYEKIKNNHSVEQVQNRDKIKISEIEKAGYRYYIIKDMGKYNKHFVIEQFEKFKLFINKYVI